jgi:DNA polymerase
LIPLPPKLEDLRAGHRKVSGFSFSTILADIDFETYSEAGFVWLPERNTWMTLPGARHKGLVAVGAACYSQHPSCEVLSLAYNLKDGFGSRLWKPGEPLPLDLFDHVANGNLVEAWNVSFERYIWENVCVPKYRFPRIDPKQLRCAMAKSRAFGLPGKLDNAGVVLKITNQKDKEGKRLLNKFSVPRKPTKLFPNTRILLTDDPDDAKKLQAYNVRDIVAEAEISSLVPDLPDMELQLWQCDQTINHRGVSVDVPSLNNAIKILKATLEKYNAELRQLTGGEVLAASRVAQLRKWLMAHSTSAPNLNAETVKELLTIPTLHPEVRRALEIRQAVSSASVKKIYAMKNRVNSYGRINDLFLYHAASTGRFTGAGPQPQNLPKGGPKVAKCFQCLRHYKEARSIACPWCGSFNKEDAVQWNTQAVTDALETMSTGSLPCVEFFWGNALDVISGCLRGMFISAPGHDLLCSDYSAIEAVVLAMLAREAWRIEVFRTHAKIYEMSASKITGIPYEEFEAHKLRTGESHPHRNTGKTAELASGYQGWIGAWIKFGADEFFSEEEMKTAILAWRAASPAIVEFWGGQQRRKRGQYVTEYYGLEGMAILAVLNPGQTFEYNGIAYVMLRNILYCRLLSGRYIVYHNPRLEMSDRRFGTYSLSYEKWNTNPKMGKVGWVKVYTYGGKLTENVVQATARDLLAYAIINLEQANYPIVLHVHDEIVCEVPEGFGSVAELERIMTTLPDWAKDWPIRAKGGWRAKRYTK